MSKKPGRTGRPETFNRNISITSFRTSVSVRVDEPRDPEPEIEVKPWLELRGTLEEPLNQTSEIMFSVYPDPSTKVGPARPPAVGSILGMRNGVDAVVSIPHAEFDRVWAFALSGHLKHAWMA